MPRPEGPGHSGWLGVVTYPVLVLIQYRLTECTRANSVSSEKLTKIDKFKLKSGDVRRSGVSKV